MINRRGGATTSLVLAIAGVVGVGVAGGMALTGTTPCKIMSACGLNGDAKVETVAMTGDAASCPITGTKATTVASTSGSDCCASKTDAAPVAQTVALADYDCSGDPECAVDDGVACSTKGDDCHKVQPINANGVEVQVVTASHTAAEGEVCAMAASCSPANCTEGMMKACTDSGKICPEDKSAQPVAQPVAQTAEAGSCCSSTGKAAIIAAASKPAAEVLIAPDAMRQYRVLSFTGKGMPMLIPAALNTASACETKDAGSCGGGGCGEKKAAETTATTASLN